MKRLIMIFVICFIVGFGVGVAKGNSYQGEKKEDNKLTIENVIKESTDNFVVDNGEIGFELSDESWGVINEKEKRYIFQPVEMEDWNYEFDNLKDFKNCLYTYLKNNNSIYTDSLEGWEKFNKTINEIIGIDNYDALTSAEVPVIQ